MARPRVRRGRAYWSISPAMAPQPPTTGGIPVGFADDTDYLTSLERRAVNRVLAVPSGVVASATVDSFRRRTLAHLVLTEDLSLISVWSPTFLTTLVDELLADTPAVLDAAPASTHGERPVPATCSGPRQRRPRCSPSCGPSST